MRFGGGEGGNKGGLELVSILVGGLGLGKVGLEKASERSGAGSREFVPPASRWPRATTMTPPAGTAATKRHDEIKLILH